MTKKELGLLVHNEFKVLGLYSYKPMTIQEKQDYLNNNNQSLALARDAKTLSMVRCGPANVTWQEYSAHATLNYMTILMLQTGLIPFENLVSAYRPRGYKSKPKIINQKGALLLYKSNLRLLKYDDYQWYNWQYRIITDYLLGREGDNGPQDRFRVFTAFHTLRWHHPPLLSIYDLNISLTPPSRITGEITRL